MPTPQPLSPGEERQAHVVTVIGGSKYLPGDVRCDECGAIITRPIAFVQKVRVVTPEVGEPYAELVVLCPQCTARVESEVRICQVCRGDIRNPKLATAFSPQCAIHNTCVHCEVCAIPHDSRTEFVVIMEGQTPHILCAACTGICRGTFTMRGRRPFVGRLNPALLTPDFENRCERCGKQLRNLAFVAANDQLMCAACGAAVLEQ